MAFLTQQGNLFRRFLKVLGRMAGVENVRPHRWRDTFAIDLLVHDTPLEDVSDLLGHRDTKITLEYYRPWVKPLQQRLVRNVIATWKRR